MKFSFAAIAVCAVPALAQQVATEEGIVIGTQLSEVVQSPPLAVQSVPNQPLSVASQQQQSQGSPHHPEHYFPLTGQFVCDRLNYFAEELELIYDLAEVIECGEEYNHCYKEIVKATIKVEFLLDLFDDAIDLSDLNRCFSCREESQIACCYRNYAEGLIAVIQLLAEKGQYLDGETDKYVVSAINSLKSADYTFVYELVRRMHCEESQTEIMKLQGARDGSTQGSIRQAFALIEETPYIVGDDFANQ